MASKTSRDAFHSLTPSELGDAQARVLRLLQAAPEGLTGPEIDAAIGGAHTDHRRARDLVVAGLAHEAGTRRNTLTGKANIVFRAGAGSTSAPVSRTPRVIPLAATLTGSAQLTAHVYVLGEVAQAEWRDAEEMSSEVSTVITDVTDYLDW